MTPALLPWPTDASPSARIACSRRSESGRGAKKSEHEKTAGDIVGVGSEAGGGGKKPSSLPLFPLRFVIPRYNSKYQ